MSAPEACRGQPVGRRLRGTLAAVAGACCYGVNGPAARAAAQAGVDGATLIVLRSVLILAVLGSVLRARGGRFLPVAAERGHLVAMGLASGATGLCFLFALAFAPVAIVVTVFYTFPLWIMLAVACLGGGRPSLLRILAFTVAFAGVLLLVGPELDRLDLRGLALALGASLASAAVFLLAARNRAPELVTVLWTQGIAMAMALPVLAILGGAAPAVLWAAAVPVMVTTLGFAVGFVLQITAAALISPASAGLLFLIEPLVAIAGAALVLGESLSLLQVAAVGLVLGGLALDIMGTREERHAP